MCQNLGLTLKEIVKLLVRTPIPKVRKRRISLRKSGSRINYLAPRPLPLEQPRSNSGFIWNTKNYPSNGYFSFFQMFSLFSKKAAVIYRWIELEVPFSIFLLKSWKKRPSQFFFGFEDLPHICGWINFCNDYHLRKHVTTQSDGSWHNVSVTR